MDNIYKSSKTTFARFASLIKPQTAEWRANAGDWINTGMVEVGNAANLKEVVRTIKVANHRLLLPTNAKTVRFIEYNDRRLLKKTEGREVWYDYDHTQPNYVRTSFEKGEVRLVYCTLNLDVDGYPMIPQDATGALDEYLFFYILRNWLISNTHTVFNYDGINRKIEGPEGHPQVGLKFKASNALKWLSKDDMEVLRDATIGLYKDYDRFSSEAEMDDLPVDTNYLY